MNKLNWLMLMLSTLMSCGPIDEAAVPVDDELVGSEAPVTWVEQSKVERQSIGNCWVYAATGWAESLNKAATGTEMNLSQSYITYWHWFDQIVNGRVGKIETGASYFTALALFDRYGLMDQQAFIPFEASAEMSARQASAQKAIDLSLASGVLSDPAKRGDRAVVRAELDKAWALDSDVVRLLNSVFGASVNRTVERNYTARRPPSVRLSNGTRISVMRAQDISVRVKKGNEFTTGTLADVMGTPNGWSRSGPLAWSMVNYPSSASARRTMQTRVQRALHDHQPVVLTWFVDFNALAADGSFSLEKLGDAPGGQGNHMGVMYDYEVDNVPGFGTLKAGVDETRSAALSAALSPEATVKFFRVKNSWGVDRPDRWVNAPLPGYHDLYTTYLDGPIKRCETKADGSTDTARCNSTTQPFRSVVLPAGY
jgi:hypothetical protein